MPTNTPIHLLDYVILAAYLIAVLTIGFRSSRKKKSAAEYFAGNKSIPGWAVAMSILATIISSVTFLGYPGQAYDKNWLLLVQGLMVPIVLLSIIWFIVPIYRRSIGISAYEYFEHRFGYSARLYSSLGFSLMHFTKMGSVVYLLAVAIERLTGISAPTVILIMGTLTILYTLVGGIEAIIWTDVLQGFLFLSGGLVCVLILLFKPHGGQSEVISLAWRNGKMGVGPYDLNFSKPTLIVMVINGIFYYLQKYCADQTMVQRYLIAKTDRAAIRSTLTGGLMCVPTWTMFMFLGSCLWAFYHITQLPLPKGIRADQVFPYFISTQLPAGVVGLVLAALLAAAMSNISSDLNCLSAVIVEDYYRRLFRNSTDTQRLRTGKIAVLVCGCATMGVALLYYSLHKESILETIFGLYAMFSGGIVGLFALGFFVRRANWQGVLIGIFACILFSAWGIVTYQPKDTHRLVDLGRFNYTQHAYMLGVYSHFVLFGVGLIASFFFPEHLESDRFTIYGFLARERAELLAAGDSQRAPREVKAG